MSKAKTRIDELNGMLPDSFEFAAWTPDDGVTRYRIVEKGTDYFLGEYPAAIGFSQAVIAARYFMIGIIHGMSIEREVK